MKLILSKVLLICVVLISIPGCDTLGPRSSSSKELSNVFIPVKDSLISTDKKPLVFPTTVAILMVPGQERYMVPDSTLRLAAEELKKGLLKNDKYINGVSIVSSSDINQKISLDTIRNMYGADIVIVLSYQQDQRRTQNGFAAFLDMAIAPIFLVPGVKVTTSTIIDGKIIHIPSNAIIFRSSGVDERSVYLTRYSSDKNQSDEESIRGLNSSVNKFGENVSAKLAQLDRFDMSTSVSVNNIISDQPGAQGGRYNHNDSWARVDSYKHSGGGAFGLMEIFALGLMAVFRPRKKL